MAALIDCITFDCADPRRIAAFWAAALGYETAEDEGDWIALRRAQDAAPLLGFQQVPEPKAVKNRGGRGRAFGGPRRSGSAAGEE
jgi:catechol 2,3-dioxygenase-like lactoylglutathione lyase family enzyme